MAEPSKLREVAGESGESAAPASPPVVVKKYANRRLYNTESSSYVTLEDLARMVRAGRDFVVYDAKSGDDITRSVLTQIIVEEEAKGSAMLPTSFLRQLIGMYGGNLQAVVPRYLETMMGGFAQQGEQMRRSMEAMSGGVGNGFGAFQSPLAGLEELSKQNMAMMERAMSLFSPFPNGANGRGAAEAPPSEVEVLREEITSLKQELSRLRGGKG
ncbi:polyhydroxyalkanoate synthesis repressor PhaR [Roseomonas elaeocarpi]|uniref:Polyhydroxyalkanoate synthesis repressor PhaR n=1 Tax=Roseomonas elaeocarpi TaxID=907779 RepID=A0ABV6K0H0_9PROT